MRTPRNTMYRILGLGLFLAIGVGQPTVAAEQTALPLRFDSLDGYPIYQTPPLTIQPGPGQVAQWESAIFPVGLTPAYRVEVWDGRNRPIPGYVARPVADGQLDLREIDPSVYSRLRFIVFPPRGQSMRSLAGAVEVTHDIQPNIRLFVFVGLASAMFLTILCGLIWWRLGPKQIVTMIVATIRGLASPQTSAAYAAIAAGIVACSLMTALALGSFTDLKQVGYLMVKLPFLYLCALLISALSGFVLFRLVGVTLSGRELLGHSLGGLLVTALALAATSPIILFFSLTKVGHDGVLLITLFVFVISGALGIQRWGRMLQRQGVRWAWVMVGIWSLVYGTVLLQLGWLLRPWVGVIDPVTQTLPFSRLYSGNVYLEILHTLERYLSIN